MDVEYPEGHKFRSKAEKKRGEGDRKKKMLILVKGKPWQNRVFARKSSERDETPASIFKKGAIGWRDVT